MFIILYNSFDACFIVLMSDFDQQYFYYFCSHITARVCAGLRRDRAVDSCSIFIAMCVCVLKAHRGKSRDCCCCRQAPTRWAVVPESEDGWLLSD